MTMYDDEIDLRPIIRTILANWWRIALIALVAALIGLSTSLLRSHTYRATAAILLTRTRASLALANQFQTVNEPIDTRSRMDAILSIARNDNLALQSYEVYKNQLPGMSFRSFRSAVEVRDQGDLILVAVTMEDPAIATDIANTWAELAEEAINTAYSAQQLPEEIQSQLSPAREEYIAAQNELEKFIQAEQSYLLHKQIEEAQTLVDNILMDKTWYGTFLTKRKQSLEQIIVQAEALKHQLDRGRFSSAAEIGDALAVLRARASTFNDAQSPQVMTGDTVASPTYNFQLLDITSLVDSTTNASKDLENFIQQANNEKTITEDNLEIYYQELVNGQKDSTLTGIVEWLQELQTQLERETARKTELTNKRDSVWLAYKNLSEKETEVKNTYPTTSQVTISNRAIIPQIPESRGTVLITIAAGFAGLVLGILWYVGTPWIKSIRNLPPDIEGESPS